MTVLFLGPTLHGAPSTTVLGRLGYKVDKLANRVLRPKLYKTIQQQKKDIQTLHTYLENNPILSPDQRSSAQALRKKIVDEHNAISTKKPLATSSNAHTKEYLEHYKGLRELPAETPPLTPPVELQPLHQELTEYLDSEKPSFHFPPPPPEEALASSENLADFQFSEDTRSDLEAQKAQELEASKNEKEAHDRAAQQDDARVAQEQQAIKLKSLEQQQAQQAQEQKDLAAAKVKEKIQHYESLASEQGLGPLKQGERPRSMTALDTLPAPKETKVAPRRNSFSGPITQEVLVPKKAIIKKELEKLDTIPLEFCKKIKPIKTAAVFGVETFDKELNEILQKDNSTTDHFIETFENLETLKEKIKDLPQENQDDAKVDLSNACSVIKQNMYISEIKNCTTLSDLRPIEMRVGQDVDIVNKNELEVILDEAKKRLEAKSSAPASRGIYNELTHETVYE